MPTLDGYSVFGWNVSMQTVDNPRAQQLNSYFGLSGLESLDGGLRGRYTNVSGKLYGTTAAYLASAEETLRAFNDGLTHTLVDTYGLIWLNVKLETFEPQGRVQVYAGNGIYWRPYAARFLHL